MNRITSGGISGKKLNNEKYNIPEFNNICGIIKGNVTKLEIAKEFVKLGWSVRKCTFTDFEIEGEWVEFIIEGNSETLLNGSIDTEYLTKFEEILQSINIKYSIELYDEEYELIKTVANNQYKQ